MPALLEDRRRGGFKAVLAGTLIKKAERRGRNDQMYAFVSFSDPTGMFEVMLFPEVLAACRPLLEAGKSLLITASAEWDGDELKLRAASIADLDAAAANAGEGLRVHLAGQFLARRDRRAAQAARQGHRHASSCRAPRAKKSRSLSPSGIR